MGKGDKPRPVDRGKYDRNWEVIFGGGEESAVEKEDGGSLIPEPGSDPLTSTFVKPSENVNECKHEIDWSND